MDDNARDEKLENRAGTDGSRAADVAVPPSSLTDTEELLYLINFLRDERIAVGTLTNRIIPWELEDRRAYLRGLLNMRAPKPAPERFIAVQDDYLSRRLIERGGPVDSSQFPPFRGDRSEGVDRLISLWQGDETLLAVGAAVNGARRDLLGCFMPGHNCIDNAIHTYAGVQMRLACNKISEELGHPASPSSSYLTPGFNLPAKHVIHTVCPFADGDIPSKNQQQQLGDCYRNCLKVAADNGIGSISFCCISTGVYGFPRDYAARIAVEAVRGFLQETGVQIHVVFDMFRDDDVRLYQQLLA